MNTKDKGCTDRFGNAHRQVAQNKELEQKLLGMIENLKEAEKTALDLSAIAGGVGGILRQVGNADVPSGRKPYLVKELTGLIKEAGMLAAHVKEKKGSVMEEEPYAKKLFESAIPKVAAEIEKVSSLGFDDHSKLEEASSLLDEAQSALSAIINQISGSRTQYFRELFALEVAHENVLAAQATVEELDAVISLAHSLREESNSRNQWLKGKRSSEMQRLVQSMRQ